MKRIRIIQVCIVCVFLLILSVQVAAQEKIKLTGYYPSPVGAFKDLCFAERFYRH